MLQAASGARRFLVEKRAKGYLLGNRSPALAATTGDFDENDTKGKRVLSRVRGMDRMRGARERGRGPGQKGHREPRDRALQRFEMDPHHKGM